MGKRVDWTAYEQGQVYAATVDLLKNRKVSLPVEPPGKEFLQAIRDAQVSLPENRRRPFASIDSLTGDLAKRFVDNGIIRKDHHESYRRGWNKKQKNAEAPEVDPRDTRIEELQHEVTGNNQYIQELHGRISSLEAELEYWKNQPGPMDFIQQWVAQTLSLAMQGAEAAKRRSEGGMEPAPDLLERYRKQPIPQFERERRKDPTPTPGTGDLRPKFAVVGDLLGPDKEAIHKECGTVAQMRYLDATNKLQGLKQFNANSGRVVIWTDHASHEFENTLKSLGVTYKRFTGSLPQLIEHIKHEALKKSPA